MTRFISYLRRRADRLSHRAALGMANGDPLGDKVTLAAVLVVFAWLGLDSINGYLLHVEQQATTHAVKRSAAEIDRLERVIVQCLNGQPIAVGGVAFECKTGSLGVTL